MLFGEANHALPYFVYAFEIMGESGVGKKLKEHRGRFVLNNVMCDGEKIYDFESKKLTSCINKDFQLETYSKNSTPYSELKIDFLTPLRLKHHNELSSKLPFHILVRAMLRRISNLFAHFGGGEPELDYRGLIAQAGLISIKSSNLRWHDWERYSNRQDISMLMGGLMGSITYIGELSPYMPIIHMSKILHIGKQTSFGLGLFEYETASAELP